MNILSSLPYKQAWLQKVTIKMKSQRMYFKRTFTEMGEEEERGG